MRTDLINFKDLQKKIYYNELTSAEIGSAQLFNGKGTSYLNEFNLFVVFNRAIPSCIEEEAINCPIASKRFAEV